MVDVFRDCPWLLFFFSSRRRHTRWPRDWSSDVCSSDLPWRFAVGADFAFPETSGQRPFGITLVNWYSRRLQIVAQRDAHVRRVFTAVQQLVTPPRALFAPRMAAK